MDYWILENSLLIIKTQVQPYNIIVILKKNEKLVINGLIAQCTDFYAYGANNIIKIGTIKNLGNGFYSIALNDMPEKAEIFIFNERGDIVEKNEIIF